MARKTTSNTSPTPAETAPGNPVFYANGDRWISNVLRSDGDAVVMSEAQAEAYLLEGALLREKPVKAAKD